MGDVKAGTHVYASNRSSPQVVSLRHGCFGLTNATLDVPWGKLVRGKARFLQVLSSVLRSRGERKGEAEDGEEEVNERLARALMDGVLRDEEQCETQVTGYPEAFERELSRVCCPGNVAPPRRPGERFGTTAHSVLLIETSGRVSFYEAARSCDPPHKWGELKRHQFHIK